MSDLFKELETAQTGHRAPLSRVLENLKFNADGLVPAIAQQHDDSRVLMLAWMNAESIRETLETGRVCYWSRSRGTYWRKGETSGNIQQLVSMRIDCDGDTLLLLVDQHGPACHTNRPECFYLHVDRDTDSVMVGFDE